MNQKQKTERETQNRVIRLFQNELGYAYLGDWNDRTDNSNVEESILTDWLKKNGYEESLVNKALHKIRNTIGNKSISLYEANKNFYSLLRYGVNIQPSAGQHKQNVHLIDWENPQVNDFAIAEEVSIEGFHKKRPDIVLYVNGIALGVLELKRSTVSVSEGIRQNLDNQNHLFIGPFFHTMQLVMAGNDSEGLRYGSIETPEKYYLTWKEVREQNLDNPNLLEMTKAIRGLSQK